MPAPPKRSYRQPQLPSSLSLSSSSTSTSSSSSSSGSRAASAQKRPSHTTAVVQANRHRPSEQANLRLRGVMTAPVMAQRLRRGPPTTRTGHTSTQTQPSGVPWPSRVSSPAKRFHASRSQPNSGGNGGWRKASRPPSPPFTHGRSHNHSLPGSGVLSLSQSRLVGREIHGRTPCFLSIWYVCECMWARLCVCYDLCTGDNRAVGTSIGLLWLSDIYERNSVWLMAECVPSMVCCWAGCVAIPRPVILQTAAAKSSTSRN